MDTKAISLQEKIQKLIDQYTKDKKILTKLEEENANLSEENSQLMAQIASFNQSQSGTNSRIKELEKQYQDLEKKYEELQNSISGFESIASDAIDQIDLIFPDLEGDKKK